MRQSSSLALAAAALLLAAAQLASANLFFTAPGPQIMPELAQCALDGASCSVIGMEPASRNLLSPPMLDLSHGAVYAVASTTNTTFPNAFVRMIIGKGADASFLVSPVPGVYVSPKFDPATQRAFFIAGGAVYSALINSTGARPVPPARLYSAGNPTSLAVDSLRSQVFVWDQQALAIVVLDYSGAVLRRLNSTQADGDTLLSIEVDYINQWVYMRHSLRIDRVNYQGASYQNLVQEELADGLVYNGMALDMNQQHQYRLYYTLQGTNDPTDTRKLFRVSVDEMGNVSEYPQKIGTDIDMALFAIDGSTYETASVNYWSIVFPWIIASVALIGAGVVLVVFSLIRHRAKSDYQPVDQ